MIWTDKEHSPNSSTLATKEVLRKHVQMTVWVRLKSFTAADQTLLKVTTRGGVMCHSHNELL